MTLKYVLCTEIDTTEHEGQTCRIDSIQILFVSNLKIYLNPLKVGELSLKNLQIYSSTIASSSDSEGFIEVYLEGVNILIERSSILTNKLSIIGDFLKFSYSVMRYTSVYFNAHSQLDFDSSYM